jgi:hypothetical protein
MQAERVYLDPPAMRCKRLRRTVVAAARNLQEEVEFLEQHRGRSGYRKTFITLTYRNVNDWKPGHISRFIRLMRQWFGRRGERCRVVWVAELQKRGALHYHALVFVPKRLLLPCPDRCGWWPHGSSKIETARNPVGYMVKYASKITPVEVKRMPKGVRLHGTGGHAPVNRVWMRQGLFPRWFHEHAAQVQVDEFEAARLAEERHYAILAGEIDSRDDPPQQEPDPDADLQRYAADCELVHRMAEAKPGTPNFRRVVGGYVDVWTGELVLTPWRVGFDEVGLIYVQRKEVIE